MPNKVPGIRLSFHRAEENKYANFVRAEPPLQETYPT